MISQFEPPVEDTSRRKRLKVTSACTECRRRKTKCDGAQPCASCSKAKVECRYVSSKNTTKEPIPSAQQQQQQQQQQRQLEPQPQQPHSPFQHHHLEDHRRPSFNSHNLAKGMRPSFSSSATSHPPTSRHSFSHFVSQPQTTPPSRSRPSQEPRRSTLTIASIEERLATIERILRTILESSVARSSLVNKDVVEKGLSTNADSMKGVAHHPYLSENTNTTTTTAKGSTDIARDYLRLPPLYNNDPSSASNHLATKTSPSSSPPPPPSTHGLLEQRGSTTTGLVHHDDAETSTSSLPPMVTGFKRPHDATTGQVSTALQPIYVTTTPLDHAVQQHTRTDHRSSSAGIDTLTTTSSSSDYTLQHPPYSNYTTIPLPHPS